jgi:hypothetical protein
MRLRTGAIAAAAVVGLVGSLDVAEAQTTRVRGKGEQARVIARSEVPLGDGVIGRLESFLRVLKSSDSDSDPVMRQNRTMRGQAIVIHPSGDRHPPPSFPYSTS